MTNHSVIAASGKTHAKIGFLALALSAVFVALVSASGGHSATARARASGPIVKASLTKAIATTSPTVVR